MKITKTEKVVIALIAVFAVITMVSLFNLGRLANKYEKEKEKEQRTAYKAWERVTGNEKELTYDEWKALSDKGLLPKEGKRAEAEELRDAD